MSAASHRRGSTHMRQTRLRPTASPCLHSAVHPPLVTAARGRHQRPRAVVAGGEPPVHGGSNRLGPGRSSGPPDAGLTPWADAPAPGIVATWNRPPLPASTSLAWSARTPEKEPHAPDRSPEPREAL